MYLIGTPADAHEPLGDLPVEIAVNGSNEALELNQSSITELGVCTS